MLFVGVDGGGTRTRAVAVGEEGAVRAWAVAGAGNYQLIGRDGVSALLARLLAELGADASGEQLSLCVALAGAGRAAEQADIGALVRARGWARRVVVVSDARAALEGAHGGRGGLIVIAGTGSMVLGKGDDGREVRAGGLGPLLGDEGSGYALGLAALQAVFRARDGWGPATSLDGSLLAELGLGDWDALIAPLYDGRLGRERIAALAPVVLRAAAAGDAAARQIVACQGALLGRQVAAVARRLALPSPVAVACAGGVLRSQRRLWGHVAAAAAAEGVQVHKRPALLPPVLGAVLLAWQAAGYSVSPAMLARLARSAPKLG